MCISLVQLRCNHCPIPAATTCQGEDVHRFCELLDPGHAAYDVGYIKTLRAMSHREPQADARPPNVVEAIASVMRELRASTGKKTIASATLIPAVAERLGVDKTTAQRLLGRYSKLESQQRANNRNS